jgi:hypothetical protein
MGSGKDGLAGDQAERIIGEARDDVAVETSELRKRLECAVRDRHMRLARLGYGVVNAQTMVHVSSICPLQHRVYKRSNEHMRNSN